MGEMLFLVILCGSLNGEVSKYVCILYWKEYGCKFKEFFLFRKINVKKNDMRL